MVVDSGGGTTEVALISVGDIVCTASCSVGGFDHDETILHAMRRDHGMAIGEETAERIKIGIGAALPPDATTSRDDNPVGAMTLQSTMPDGSLVLSSIELAGRHLRIDVNSEARAEHADAMLSSLLQGLVGTPVVTQQSIEEVMAGADSSETFEADALSPADERQGLGHVLEDHYRRVLDEPLPALDGMTPREAAQAADSRDKVVAWLKVIENSQAHASPGNAVASYDLGWMWAELGLAKYRR